MNADLLVPVVRETPLVRCNPVAKLAAGAVLAISVVLSIDVVSAAVMLGLVILMLPLTGLDLAVLVKRLWFLPLAALMAGWGTALLSQKTGTVIVGAGPLLLTSDSLTMGAAVALRALALALPAVMLIATIDPTDLADSLIQHLRLPATFVLAALAAARLVTLFIAEWQTLAQARRARGVAGGNVFARIGGFFQTSFALLVQAIRRGTRLAMAMEGRGFGAQNRTWARVSTFHPRDGALVAGAIIAAAVTIGAAVAAGTWNFIFTIGS
ncbi:energy-coupling factor transporter transmembrane component T family protein [Brevibacterium luteolum]|uniref:energy-coupling factor transporter transmembrane component T family protein n=1 Tax=Brevibacterium luteolum TaxID=199591 RepID=UPI00223B0321|nr:energy-coupling factor transporter transmembrane component T [Brevibacterium luteolum]MCT1655837.1 energy-coupling factor transporter transmembrane protein EcfT [Brevibacterium luteolum]